MSNNIPPNLNQIGEAPYSRVDLFTGKHTTSIIVAILFTITLIGFIVLYCVKETMPDAILTGFLTLLGTLGGFFAGSTLKKDQ